MACLIWFQCISIDTLVMDITSPPSHFYHVQQCYTVYADPDMICCVMGYIRTSLITADRCVVGVIDMLL